MTEIDLLRQIAADIHAVRVAIERSSGAAPVDQEEHLRTVRAVVGDRVFVVGELLAHAQIDPGLRAAIVGLVGALNGRALGKLFRAIEGRDVAGLRIVRVGADRAGVILALRVCGFETRKTTSGIALCSRVADDEI